MEAGAALVRATGCRLWIWWISSSFSFDWNCGIDNTIQTRPHKFGKSFYEGSVGLVLSDVTKGVGPGEVWLEFVQEQAGLPQVF